jgi:hypothetical protein
VRKEWVKEVRRQIATYKRFKRLIDQWPEGMSVSAPFKRLILRAVLRKVSPMVIGPMPR